MSEQYVNPAGDPPDECRTKPDYPYLFHRMVTENLSVRQLAALPQAAGVSHQAISKEFRKPQWREQKIALDQASSEFSAAYPDGDIELPNVAEDARFLLATKVPSTVGSGNAEDDAIRILNAQRQELLSERRRLAEDKALLDRIAAGKATKIEREMALGINRDTVLDARRKLADRERAVQLMERRLWQLDARQQEVRQFLPIVERRGIPTMPG